MLQRSNKTGPSPKATDQTKPKDDDKLKALAGEAQDILENGGDVCAVCGDGPCPYFLRLDPKTGHTFERGTIGK